MLGAFSRRLSRSRPVRRLRDHFRAKSTLKASRHLQVVVPAANPDEAGRLDESKNADTFCVHPWIHLRVLSTEGGAQVCCRYKGGACISDNGSTLSLHERTLDEIWNSTDMRDLRRAMVEGRKVSGCAECYQEEKRGGFSMRMRDNQAWESGRLNEERATIDMLKSQALATDFRLARLPADIEIDTGNLCNLKCRMCHDGVSSRIGVDPVHSRWTVDAMSNTPCHDPDAPPRPAVIRRWLFDRDFVRTELLRRPQDVKRLYFIGGEPTLVKEVDELLQYLIDAGAASRIVLAIVTNGTITSSWLRRAEYFKALEIAVSLDGFGPIYEYIRYPSRWAEISRNIETLKRLANATVGAVVTLQAYNALNIGELFRYLDSIEVGFYAYPIHLPRYLSIDAMPPNARKLAAERLREYATRDCRPQHRELMLGLVSQLEPMRDRVDERLLRDFMLFTNDLDVSRGQRFHDTHPELLQLIADAGFPWTTETLHAGRPHPVVLYRDGEHLADATS